SYSGTAAPSGATPGAPGFPNPVSVGPTVTPNALWTVDPDFVVAHTWQSNVQVERAVGRDFTVSIAGMYAKGNDLPVVTNVNPINPIGTLADGRPIYSSAVNATTRQDPRFNIVQEVQSIGDSNFKAMTLGASKRFAKGLSFNLQYSLGKGLDNT